MAYAIAIYHLCPARFYITVINYVSERYQTMISPYFTRTLQFPISYRRCNFYQVNDRRYISFASGYIILQHYVRKIISTLMIAIIS